jgi:protein-L-isoaspartate(D-aspartate) O-methyltransferase
VPESLVSQLRVGGRLVIPIGNRFDQSLLVVVRTEQGHETRRRMTVRFVPLISSDAFPN